MAFRQVIPQRQTGVTREPGVSGHANAMAHLVNPMLRLQRTIGNRAIQRLLETAPATASGNADLEDEGHNSLERFRAGLEGRRGLGTVLPEDVRRLLEGRIGADLRDVRVHAGSEANELSTAVQARAFTTGSEIFFKDGKYDPQSQDGLRLLAHEVTHVIQQSKGSVAGSEVAEGVSISDPSDSFEQEAEQVAEQVSTSKPVSNHGIGASTGAGEAGGNASVQREGDDNDPFGMMQVIQARIAALQGNTTAGSSSASTPGTRPNDIGNVAPYNQQPSAVYDAQGRRLTENEHGMPKAQLQDMTRNPLTGEPDYTDAMYGRETTLRWEREAALHKTHGNRGGALADNPRTNSLRQERLQGRPVEYRKDIFQSRLDQTMQTRDATNSAATDAEINQSFLEPDGSVFSIKNLNQAGDTVKSLGSSVNDVSIEEYNSSPLAQENSSPLVSENSSPLVSENSSPLVSENSSPLVPETSASVPPETSALAAPETPASIAPETPASVVPEESPLSAGASSPASKTLGGAAGLGMVGGLVRDIYEGKYQKAAVDTSKNAAAMYVLSEVPELAPLALAKATIDADTPKVHQHAMSIGESLDPGDHTVIGGVVTAGAEVGESAYNGVFKPIGTDIGEGAAAAYLAISSWLSSDSESPEPPHAGQGSYSDEYVSGQ